MPFSRYLIPICIRGGPRSSSDEFDSLQWRRATRPPRCLRPAHRTRQRCRRVIACQSWRVPTSASTLPGLLGGRLGRVLAWGNDARGSRSTKLRLQRCSKCWSRWRRLPTSLLRQSCPKVSAATSGVLSVPSCHREGPERGAAGSLSKDRSCAQASRS